ncbi:MAG: hypothetical protein Kow0068_05310 [Marinilabiliales bacterium]
MKIKSPITGSYNTKILKYYPKKHFIDLYKVSLNINVSHFFSDINEVLYVICLDTGYKFFYPDSIVGNSSFYEELQQFEWYYHKEKWEFTEALKHINIKDVILEIGGGNGYFLDKLNISTENKHVIEFNQKAIQVLSNKGYSVYNETIIEHSKKRENYYDVIVLFQLLEHIYDVKSFLDAAISALKKNGKLIVAVPNCNAKMIRLDFNLSLNFPPHHIGHWNYKSLKNLEKHFNIKLESVFYEPLDKSYYKRYYRVWAVDKRMRYSFFGKAIDKFIYPFSEKIVSLLSRHLKGQSMIVIFNKK